MSPDEKPLTTKDLAEGADTRRREETALRERELERGAPTQPGAERHEEQGRAPLFEENDASGYRTQWEAIQAGFVDEPRAAVEQADALVAQVMKRLAESFASERSSLEQQWDKGGEMTTEDLRVALKRYRSFFERLLSL
jgi:hypothetical protein